MKTLSAELKNHLAEEVTMLATCWKLTRRDSAVLGFTSHDADLVIDDITYKAATGMTPSMVASNANLSVDNLEVQGMLSDDAVTEEDIHAGLYDFAQIEIFQVNYADLSQGKLTLRTGWLGEVSFSRGHFIAEVRGLTQRLSKTIGELFSPACRASLGDARCKVDIDSLTATASATAVISQLHIKASALDQQNGTFDYGILTFTSGANEGISMEVKAYITGDITFVLPLPFAIEEGDAFTVTPGCDKTFETCIARFSNAVNFRGEPHLPGIDKMLQTSSTRSEW